MNTELDLLCNILDRNDIPTLKRFLEFCEEARLFSKYPESSADLIPRINSLLNETPKRLLGALLLKSFLPQCPRNFVGPHLFSWIQVSIRGVLSLNESELVDVSLIILGELIPLSLEFPDVRKEVSQNLSWKIVECLIRDVSQTEHKILALRCLREFLQGYGKSCGQFKESLFKFLLSQIDCSPDIVHAAGQCYLALAAVGSPGTDFENYKSSWESQQTFLVNSLHFVLSGLFEGVSEIQGPSNPVALKEISTSLPPIVEKLPLLRAIKRSTQFKGLGEFLCFMLGGKFVTSKRLSLESLLSIICRTLAFNCDTVKSNLSLDSLYVSMQVPLLHETAINILSALISSCRLNLATHGELICKLLAQTLKCTQADDWPYGHVKPFGFVRKSVYNCLELWLTVSRSSCNIKDALPKIVSAIMYDIRAVKPVVQINVQTKRMKGKEGKKQRQAMAMNSLTNETEIHSGNRLVDNMLFIASLRALSALFLYCSSQLDLKDVKKLINEIIHQLLILETPSTNTLTAPYDDEDCRLELFSTFLTVCSLRRHNFTAPLNVAHSVFSEGLKDPSPKVVSFCGFAAHHISRLVQPHAPTLEFQPVLSNDPIVVSSTTPAILSPRNPAVTLNSRSGVVEQVVEPTSNFDVGDQMPPGDRLADAVPSASSPLSIFSPPVSLHRNIAPELSLVCAASPCQNVKQKEGIDSSDDEIMELEPQNENKRPLDNGFEPHEKHAKSSTPIDETINQKVTVTSDIEEKTIDKDMSELEKDMLSSFINLIDD